MFENLYNELIDKYGDSFNWTKILKTKTSFLEELNSELSKMHPLYKRAVKAVAKCDSNDDVLFLLDNDNWAIVHLTYSKNNIDEFPKYKYFSNISDAMTHIEEQFIVL